jgi:hypothetical protein
MGWIGPRSHVEAEIAQVKADEFVAVGDNIAGGPGGAIGYLWGGVQGSYYGAAFDQMLFSNGGIEGEYSSVLSRPKLAPSLRAPAYTEVDVSLKTLKSEFLGGSKGSLYSKRNIIEGNHAPSMQSLKLAGFKIAYAEASAYQMLYEEHRSFISTGSSKAAQAFRNQEASLLKQGKFLEAFDLNTQRVQNMYGHKYDGGIQKARAWYESQIIPQLQKQVQQNSVNK